MKLTEEILVSEDGRVRKEARRSNVLFLAAGLGWLVFLLLWFSLLLGGHNAYQNVGIFLISLMTMALILSAICMKWAFKDMTEFRHICMRGMKARMVMTMIAPIAGVMSLGLWLFFLAAGLDLYQNVAVAIISLVVIWGIMRAIWGTERLDQDMTQESKKHL